MIPTFFDFDQLKREFPAVLLSNSDHIETSQNTNCRNQELSGMTRASPPHRITSVWHIYSDFHSVFRLIYMRVLPTRTPLSTLEQPPPALRGRIEISSKEKEIYRKHTPLGSFRHRFR